MKLKEITFHYFRSFGKKQASIDFDENITFFVGKNHTGKTNLMKFLEDIKRHNLPFNEKYVLERSNWYNNESGIERPLKFRITASINNKEYRLMTEKMFLEPILNYFKELSLLGDYDIKSESKAKLKNLLTFKNCKNIFYDFFPNHEIILRMEFIRFDDNTQSINYSAQFNNLIVIKTGHGRRFIKTIIPEEDKLEYRPHEKRFWSEYLGEMLRSLVFENNKDKNGENDTDGDERGLEMHRSLDLGNIGEELNLDKLLESSDLRYHILGTHLLQTLKREITPFKVDAEEIIDPFYRKFLSKIQTFHGSRAHIPEVNQDNKKSLDHYLARRLLQKNIKAVNDVHLRRRMHQLTEYFESLYDSLNISFGISKQNNGSYEMNYYKRDDNSPIQNFDSIGGGITEMLYFLYKFTIEEGNLLFLDCPERNLHPHNQRFIYNIIKEYSEKNQVFLATHSPFFIQPDDLFQIRLFDMEDDITKVIKLKIPSKSQDFFQLKRNFSFRNRDAIFADGIVFVEGPTEEWAFPTFFKNFGLDLDLNNLSLISLHGKGGFGAFWKFAHQLRKNFWFFFDYDVLGVKAGEEITPKTFKRSIIYKKRYLFEPEVASLCNQMIYMENDIHFHEKLEYLRSLLEKYHVFVFPTDFERVFEAYLRGRAEFTGSKVEKAIQLVDYIKEHEREQLIPNRLYRYIQIIQEDLEKEEA